MLDEFKRVSLLNILMALAHAIMFSTMCQFLIHRQSSAVFYVLYQLVRHLHVEWGNSSWRVVNGQSNDA